MEKRDMPINFKLQELKNALLLCSGFKFFFWATEKQVVRVLAPRPTPKQKGHVEQPQRPSHSSRVRPNDQIQGLIL